MPLSLPPWLEIKPSDFLHAAASGAEAGLAVARLNQQAEESAANRGSRTAEMQAQRELQQWEHEQAAQLRAEEIASAREKSRAELSARTAYNLANLGLRDRGQKSREQASQESLSFRREQQGRLQQIADQQERALELRVKQAQSKMPQQQAMALQDLYIQRRGLKKAANDPFTRPEALPQMQEQINALDAQIANMMPAPAAAPAMGQDNIPEPGPRLSIPGVRIPSAAGTLSMGTPAEPTIPGMAAPSPTATPTLTAPAAPSFTPAPPKSNRKVGETYQTPKGPHTWTEDGWLPYSGPAAPDQTSVDVPEPEEQPA